MLIALLLLAGCSAGEDPSTAAGGTPAAASPSLPSASSPEDASQRGFQAALARSVAAVAYRFDGQVTVGRPGGRTVTVQLEGQIDGDRRTLTVAPVDGGQAVTIRVAEGQATVDRGDGPQPIALHEVPDPPSLALLGELDDLEPDGSGTVTGRLPAGAVARFLPAAGPSPSPTSPATVSVSFEPGGFISGVHIETGDVTVDMTFHDFQLTGQ